jgi:DNA repair protein RecO (recombination protein O)
MKENIRTKGIVLARRNIGEADRLLTVFSEEIGKIKVIARGARKIKSRLAPHIEPFTIGRFELIEGKTFYILIGAEALPEPAIMSRDLDTYQVLSYLCELIDLTYEEAETNKSVYNLLEEVIDKILKVNSAKRALLCRYFEMKLLISLGYKPNYNDCKKCQSALVEHSHYKGSFEGVFCPTCASPSGRITKNALKALRLMERGGLEELLTIQLTDDVATELAEVMQSYLFEILPRKPKSLEI